MSKIIQLEDKRNLKIQSKTCGTGDRAGWGHDGPIESIEEFKGFCYNCKQIIEPQELHSLLVAEMFYIKGMIQEIEDAGLHL